MERKDMHVTFTIVIMGWGKNTLTLNRFATQNTMQSGIGVEGPLETASVNRICESMKKMIMVMENRSGYR